MAHLDPIVRVADGGSNKRENLQMLCACCHEAKSRLEMRRAGLVG